MSEQYVIMILFLGQNLPKTLDQHLSNADRRSGAKEGFVPLSQIVLGEVESLDPANILTMLIAGGQWHQSKVNTCLRPPSKTIQAT
jgi:hypothetical protein